MDSKQIDSTANDTVAKLAKEGLTCNEAVKVFMKADGMIRGRRTAILVGRDAAKASGCENTRDAVKKQIDPQEKAEMALKHFGIEGLQGEITVTDNTKIVAQDIFIMLAKGRGMEKARITIDYDTGFPYVLVRFNAL